LKVQWEWGREDTDFDDRIGEDLGGEEEGEEESEEGSKDTHDEIQRLRGFDTSRLRNMLQSI
jgi:hypothetical protein